MIPDGHKVAFAILRSREDGHQILGPMIVDRFGIETYKRLYASDVRLNGLWLLEGFVWVQDKPQPEGWALLAEEIEAPGTGLTVFPMLTKRR